MFFSPGLERAIVEVRLNRFLAVVRMNGRAIRIHVPNSGRMRELMVKGAQCALLPASNDAERKTKWSLELVKHRGTWVGIHSARANQLFAEAFEKGMFAELGNCGKLSAERTIGRSRFDFVIDGPIPTVIEVKSVTLRERGGVAAFPDAPTERGARHLEELAHIRRADPKTRCAVVFVAQRNDVLTFAPHDSTDPQFGRALREARDAGVQVIACKCKVGMKGISIHERVEAAF